MLKIQTFIQNLDLPRTWRFRECLDVKTELDRKIMHQQVLLFFSFSPSSSSSTSSSSSSCQFTGLPTFRTSPPATLQITELTTAALKCVAFSVPLPTISWQFNGAPLSNGTRSGRVTYTSIASDQFELTSVLTIATADYNTDRGRYTCVAQNTQGAVNANSSLDVWSKFVFY